MPLEMKHYQIEPLPNGWEKCFSEDGRIFFVNNRERYTTWLNPNTEEPELTGNFAMQSLPTGWETSRLQNGLYLEIT